MGQAYEFDGRYFDNAEEFLDAIAHEYKIGDKDLAVDKLEDYGFTINDINVRPEAA